MRTIHTDKIIETVRDLCIEGCCNLRCDTVKALKQAQKTEPSPVGREVLAQLVENSEIARCEKLPFCQDTGYAVLFVELGQEVRIEGDGLTDALNEGVRRGYKEGYLRMSIVNDPLTRKNTGDNTPATINYTLVPGETFKISLLVKGGGCDMRSALKIFEPAAGLEGVMNFIVETVEKAGANASPPMTLGIGMGGPFAQAALLAQRALLWPLDVPNPDPKLREIEAELIKRINNLGIGPAGFGGRTTCLGAHIELGPAHIAHLPVAINIDCHSHRGAEATL
ncbi:fumarate hydratase [Simkania negevensis]|uniref:Putative fumarate hydratase subunit alpha n=1 Tax=Simkania negevensis (strain ATCC VR-1471 / DSM 27360 / Z) TaxID=331113 RepID=F8L6E9_SIMNZ|nr:fumarate hydratase [Simkania negevensis]CCB88279.1 putative fumarate hydratase subunit alpha [Simkania negevensis Z]